MVGIRKAMAASVSSAAIFIFGLAPTPSASQVAGLLADDEARRAIIDMRIRLESMESKVFELERRLQLSAQGQLQTLNENERLRSELARLRGQIEEAQQIANTGRSQQRDLFLDLDRRLNQQNELLSQQKDLYVDIDQRIKQIEPVPLSVDGVNYRVSPQEKAKLDELRELLRNGEFRRSVSAAEAFQQAHPASVLASHVLLLKGSALYADKDYKAAILARQDFIDRYPNHPARPQAILNLAASQAESGNPNAARSTLESLIKSYPNSSAATEARDRLKTLRPASPSRPAPSKAGASK